jgi:large subunit ribosomal protein L24e
MAKCSFCGSQIEPGTGLAVIRNDGRILRFDNKKCETSMIEFRRDSRNTKWVTKKKEEKNQ